MVGVINNGVMPATTDMDNQRIPIAFARANMVIFVVAVAL